MIVERTLARLPDAANNDGEFKLAARLWDGDVVLVSGDDGVRLGIEAGRIIDVARAQKDAPAQIRVIGPADGWAKMLQPAPPPFYQDVFAASARHGFQIDGAIEDVGPYYPALRRLIELLRGD